VIQVTIENQTLQVVQLTEMVPFSENYADVGTAVQVQLISLRNPATTTTTSAFSIQWFEQDFIIMESTSVTLTATPGNLTNCLVVPDTYRTRTATPYKF